MLEAIKDNPNAFLYSIDYATQFHRNKSKPVGYEILENHREYMKKWKLYTGNVAAKFIEEIGGDIDIAFIDTAHFAPGEIMDFLMILPFLKENATVIIHDIHLNHGYAIRKKHCTFTNRKCHLSYTNNLLVNYIRGDSYLPHFTNNRFIDVNSGAVKLYPNQKKYYYNYIHMLSVDWLYMPKDSDIMYTRYIIKKYYDEKCLKLFDLIIKSNKEIAMKG